MGKSLTGGGGGRVLPGKVPDPAFLIPDADQVLPLSVDKDTNLKTKKIKIFYGEQSSPILWFRSEST